jgi:hypothetical protein
LRCDLESEFEQSNPRHAVEHHTVRIPLVNLLLLPNIKPVCLPCSSDSQSRRKVNP